MMNGIRSKRAKYNEEKHSNATHSDLNLADRVSLAFTRLGYTQLEDVECRSHGDHVFLDGRLHSFYLKQVAQTIAMKIPGVCHVTNNIEVGSEDV